MKRFLNWRTTLLILSINLFIALQPAITFACTVGGNPIHGGC